jgi:acetate CoA/acetoacetate CoA-transferase alpha subunit
MKTISLEQAVAMILDGASLIIGGFVTVATPERVMDEIVRQGKRSLGCWRQTRHRSSRRLPA